MKGIVSGWKTRLRGSGTYNANTSIFMDGACFQLGEAMGRVPNKFKFNFFLIGPQNVSFLTKKYFKKIKLVSQNFICCSQNLPKPILVLKKSILRPLFTVYRFFLNVNFGVDPPPPLLEKVYILDFFASFPKSEKV